MSAGAILTLGLGSFAGAKYLPTLGLLSASVEPPVVVEIPGGGGGGRRRRKIRIKGIRERVEDWVEKTAAELYSEILAGDAGEELKAHAAATTRPYARKRAFAIPEPKQVDWDALVADRAAVERLARLWVEYRRRREELDDEDDVLMLDW